MKKSELRQIIKETVSEVLNEEAGIYYVRWVDGNYKEHVKKFKDDPGGAAENGLVKAKKFAEKLNAQDKKAGYTLYRRVEVGYAPHL